MSSVDRALRYFTKGMKKLDCAIKTETAIRDRAQSNKEYFARAEEEATSEIERGKRIRDRLAELLS